MPLTRRFLCTAFAALALPIARAAAADPLILGTRDVGGRSEPVPLSGWTLAYFGYTHCPDICPTGLQTMTEALDILGAAGTTGPALAAVFITVDPKRDTPPLMRDYVAAFHPRLVGLTPSPAQLEALAGRWRIKYRRVDLPDQPYLMDHSAAILLLTPDGQIAGRFPHALPAPQLAEKIRQKLGR